jgi:DNA polymerase
MTHAERQAALEEIAAEVRVCTNCRLASGRTNAVPGEGSPDTEVVFVGEGPGFNEDKQGRPFVGRAGGVLMEFLRSIEWRREEVFITNVVKCRPPDNRDPEPDEIAACAPFLRRQLETLDPALVVTLGRFSLGTFMPGTRISQVHGTVRPVDPATGAPDASVLALYHPAAADRSADVKRQSFDDIGHAPRALVESRERRAAAHGGAQAPDAVAVMAVAASAPDIADIGDIADIPGSNLEEALPASDLTIF